MESPTSPHTLETARTAPERPDTSDAISTCSRRRALITMVGAVSTLAGTGDADARSHDPEHEPLREHVDLIEINHYFDNCGKHILDQYIFYDWCSNSSRYQVRAWRLMKNPIKVPQRHGDGYRLTLYDNNIHRDITARQMRETWTLYDPELVEREFIPKERRRDLRKKPPTRAQLEELVRSLEAKNGNP